MRTEKSTVFEHESMLTLAVLAFRRPDELRAALPLLVAQLDTIDWRGEVLVVDNDPDGSAALVVAELRDPRVRYVHEATPGIAAGRNRAMDECPDSRLLVFIDDDERPIEGWLSAMLATYLRLRPTGVVGPVTSEFTSVPDPWIVAGGFFRRRSLETGDLVDVAATNNLLLDLRAVHELGLRFDLRYGITGGSDTLLTRQLTARGGRLVWCAEAEVIDVVPAQRLTRQWVLQRSYRMGNTAALVDRDMATSTSQSVVIRLRLLVSGMLRVGGGGARLLFGIACRSLPHRASGARTLSRGAGLISGATGVIYSEYTRRAE